MKKFKLITLLLVFSIPFLVIAQQEESDTETSWDVPELFAFHDVIYQIWHTGFPEKNIELLKSLVDEVNSRAQKIFDAKLSGILRDKETKWKEGLDKFRVSVENYNKAAEENDEKQILDAAEALHSDFEMLVRIIKPMSKEIDDYHQTLYMIYHYFFPEKEYEKLGKAADELFIKAERLKSADIPKRAANKKDEYLKVVENLYEATSALKHAFEQDEIEGIDKYVETVHTKYQDLEKLFD